MLSRAGKWLRHTLTPAFGTINPSPSALLVPRSFASLQGRHRPFLISRRAYTLKPRNQWTTAKTKAELIEKMEDRLAHEIPGVGISFTQPIEMRFNELVAGVRSDIGVKVFGDDLEVLKARADQIVRVLSSAFARRSASLRCSVWPF